MLDLETLVQSLDPGEYKNYYQRHIKRGMHPAEELFAKHALLALAPDKKRGPKERKENARYIFESATENIPDNESGRVFLDQLGGRLSDRGADLEIEEMIFIANIASCLSASSTSQRAMAAEKVIRDSQSELISWSTVSERKPALPVVIESGLFWLYYMNRNLRGVCIQSLPGNGRGMPVVFVDPEYFTGEKIDRDALLRVACHEMIHSSQAPSLIEEIDGWNMEAKFALLESMTEGLAILQIGDKNPFSAEEISKRDYAYFVTVLFGQLRKAGARDADFKSILKHMNSLPLSDTAAFIGSAEEFLKTVKQVANSLILQHMVAGVKNQERKSHEKPPLHLLSEVLFSGDNGLQIIEEVVSKQKD